MHPKYEYTFFEYKNDVYVVAQGLLGNFLADVAWEESDINVIGSCIGQDLELLNTKHPLIDRKSPIILGEHVTLDAGTGSVHTAPGHGLEDYEVGCKYGIEVFSPLDSKGVWTDAVPDLKGIPYYKGNSIVIENDDKVFNVSDVMKISDILSIPVVLDYHHYKCNNIVYYRFIIKISF